MSDFEFKCPSCKQSLEASEDMLGQLIECPSCGDLMDQVPRLETTTKASAQHSRPYSSKSAIKETKPCPFCGEPILAIAIKCKHCGSDLTAKERGKPAAPAPQPKSISPVKVSKKKSPIKTGCGFLIVIIVGIPLLIGFFSGLSDIFNTTQAPSRPSTKTTSPAANRPTSASRPSPAPAKPQLLLLNWTWRTEYGYAIVEGEVQNNSSESLHNVQAVAKFYTVDKKFITSCDALLEYNPILPGQKSPFKAMASYNPAMNAANISFKKFMGGTITWEKKD